MRILILITVLGNLAHADPNVSGTNNNVNICQPKIEVKSCGSCCKQKIIYKDRVVEKLVEVPVTKEVIVERKVIVTKERTKIKKHLLSIVAHRAVVSSSATTTRNGGTVTASGITTTDYVPGLTYQYQFDRGLVPMLGIDVTGSLLGGVGFEF